MASLLFKKLQQELVDFSPDIIVPVPQYWLHWFTRPHHQALTIAEVLGEQLQCMCDERLVRKTRRTIDQSSLPRTKRLTNLKQAYAVRTKRKLKGQRVLIVDDILTTGTTSNELAKVLRKAGASDVAVAVIAVVP
jgi:predicted amidophosphoribosyltransferase